MSASASIKSEFSLTPSGTELVLPLLPYVTSQGILTRRQREIHAPKDQKLKEARRPRQTVVNKRACDFKVTMIASEADMPNFKMGRPSQRWDDD